MGPKPRARTSRSAAALVSSRAALPRPVVKWAGGKWRLLDQLRQFVPPGTFRTYAEPFAGGAAMFFALAEERRFERAVLADKNAELVALYQVIKRDVDGLVERVRSMQADYLAKDEDGRREQFYDVRKKTTGAMSAVDRGARFLFLNRTCFNGLWRVNSAGTFNVPFGRYANPRILDEEALRAAHRALARVSIVNDDFAAVIAELGPEDFVYFDPPYVPLSRTANFTAYAADRFDAAEQERLARELARLRDDGVRAMLSNASSDEARKLYESHRFHVDTIAAPRAINSDPSKRGDVEELVVTTYDPKTWRVVPAARRAPRRRAAS